MRSNALRIAGIHAVAVILSGPFERSPAGAQVKILIHALQVLGRGAAPGPVGSSSGGGQQC